MILRNKYLFSYLVVVLLGVCWQLPQAHAAGMFLAPRGVRPLAQAGSYIAGADDINALSYNPAGLAGAVETLQLDMALPLHTTVFTRSVYGDDVYQPAVRGHGIRAVIPTLGAIYGFGLAKNLRFGLSLAADYPLVQEWPSAQDDPEATHRYGSGDFQGTALVKLAMGVGYPILPWLKTGASMQLLIGQVASVNTISVCDGFICTQPENFIYDATVRTDVKNIVVPGYQLGIQAQLLAGFSVGVAYESGYTIDKDAIFRVQLPKASYFSGVGFGDVDPSGTLRLSLPQQFRVGLQKRFGHRSRVELAYVYEPWSVHESIEINMNNTTLKDMLAIGSMPIGTIEMKRGYQDTWSLRLGGEWCPEWISKQAVVLRSGVMYEPTAIPQVMLTPMTVDLNKVLLAFGAQYTINNMHIEATYAHVFMFDAHVTNSQVMQINPIKPSNVAITPVGNGLYESSANLLGLGLRFDI